MILVLSRMGRIARQPERPGRLTGERFLHIQRVWTTSTERQPADPQPIATPCLCAALRQASRAVTRIYDAELREVGLRSTQLSLLTLLAWSGEVRKGDLGEMACLDETTLTRSLPPLQQNGWVTIRVGTDRREKLVSITEAGKAKVEEARPLWSKAHDRMRSMLSAETWEALFAALPEVTRAASIDAS